VRISDIQKRLTSKDPKVMKQSLDYVNQRLMLERTRGERAETRASSLLTVSSILAGFAVVFIESFREGKVGHDTLTLLFFSTSILLLAKALFYSVRALWALKGNELNAELPFDLQCLDSVQSIRTELAWKIWEYYELLPLSNQRLFWVNRAQRNVVWAFVAFLCLAVESFLSIQINLPLNTAGGIVLGSALAAGIIFLDPIAEKLGNVWTFK